MSITPLKDDCCLAQGLVSDIQRFSLHDGPGIRTTVFLKGCPLKCLWCHNPECISASPQLAFYPSKCIGCGTCAETCANSAITSGGARVDREKCVVCGACARECPAEALQVIGRTMSVDDVMAIVLRDVPFYERSGGGMTLSGGEPLLQESFALSLLRRARKDGLHTAVETCGVAPADALVTVKELTDLFFYDVKVIDPAKHRRFCGADNTGILANARVLLEAGADVVFRTPIVPGCNDSDEDIRQLGEFILSLPDSPRLQLLAYHRIGSGKYEAVGMQYQLPDVPGVDDLGRYNEMLSAMGVQLIRD